MQGKKVLLVDADPQGDLTTCLGWQDTDSLPQTLSNKLSAVMREEQQDPFSGILGHEEKVDLVPSNLDLSALEISYQILLPKMYCDPTVRKWPACQCYGRKCSEDMI